MGKDTDNILQFADEQGARTEARFPAFRSAKIVNLEDMSTIDCAIRNITSKGALIRLVGLFQPPEEFNLLMVNTKTVVRVKRVWQKGVLVGVRFEEPPKAVAISESFCMIG